MSGFIVTTTAVALIIWATIRATDWIESNNDRIDQMVHNALEDDSDDFWANWQPFDAPEYPDTPIYNELRHETDVWFAASVLADIEALPEVTA